MHVVGITLIQDKRSRISHTSIENTISYYFLQACHQYRSELGPPIAWFQAWVIIGILISRRTELDSSIRFPGVDPYTSPFWPTLLWDFLPEACLSTIPNNWGSLCILGLILQKLIPASSLDSSYIGRLPCFCLGIQCLSTRGWICSYGRLVPCDLCWPGLWSQILPVGSLWSWMWSPHSLWRAQVLSSDLVYDRIRTK